MMEDEKKPQGAQPQGVRNQTDIDIIMCLRRAVSKTFSTMCNIDLKQKPQIQLKSIIRWQGKMRIIKPLDAEYVSVITFKNPNKKNKKFEANGIIVLYISSSTSDILLPAMGLKGEFDEDDIKDACGEFLNVMAGGFKSELVNSGYDEMDISPPFNFGFKVDELFDFYQDYKFEITFFHEGERFFQVDIGLDEIHKNEQ